MQMPSFIKKLPGMLNILAQHAAQHAKKAFSTCIQQKNRQNKCQQMQIFSKMHQI